MQTLRPKPLFGVAIMIAVMLLGACVGTVLRPDGTKVVQEADTATISLMATAAIAAWAASQPNGLTTAEAQTAVKILGVLEEFHVDGTPIDLEQMGRVSATELPKRFQPLAMVLAALIEHQLAVHGVSTTIPKADNTAGKIMQAIHDGALLGLAPYLKPGV